MRPWVVLALLLAGCATYRDLTPGEATLADVEAVMGRAAEQRTRADGATSLYYPKQPFGRRLLVAGLAPDGKLIAVEQRLSEEYIAKLVPNHSRREDVLELFGQPYERLKFPRMNREAWSWHMRALGTVPASLHVQLSPDGAVREVYVLDEQKGDERKRH
jgi:hypothetical protein